jgi:hypothetical protein
MSNPLQGSPLSRAALVSVNAAAVKSSITFQYAPETMRRTIEPNVVGGRSAERAQAVRFAGAATETLTLDARFSSVETTDAGGGGARGVAPQLAALAMLAYPATADVQRAQSMLEEGSIQVLPAIADELLLVFGRARVVPCQIVSFSIVEEIYDSDLVPVLASVSLTLRLTSYSDVDPANPAWADFVTYQQNLEQLASQAIKAGGPGVGS